MLGQPRKVVYLFYTGKSTSNFILRIFFCFCRLKEDVELITEGNTFPFRSLQQFLRGFKQLFEVFHLNNKHGICVCLCVCARFPWGRRNRRSYSEVNYLQYGVYQVAYCFLFFQFLLTVCSSLGNSSSFEGHESWLRGLVSHSEARLALNTFFAPVSKKPVHRWSSQ